MAAGKIAGFVFGVACVAGSAGSAPPPDVPKTMAPLEQYLMPAADEAALARSAAPPAISGKAEIRVLTRKGYEVVARGTNGFVCMVERGWTAGFDDKVFWNPRIRGPLCLNPAAVASVLPAHLERTAWALAGLTREEMERRARRSAAANTPPAAGAMSYMMARQQYLSDTGVHWHPHLMFWVSHMPLSAWGANMDGTPVMGSSGETDPVTTFYVPVGMWSDGTPATMEH